MTTTKEDQMQRSCHEYLESSSCVHSLVHAQVSDIYIAGYKDCADSYEKKLAERDAEVEGLQAAARFWQDKSGEANARNAMLVQFITRVRDNYDCDVDAHKYGTECKNCAAASIISANSEAVAAWEAEKLEPLRREVAMLRDALNLLHKEAEEFQFDDGLGVGILDTHWDSAMGAREHTQATAEAYEREVVAKAQIQILEESYQHMQFSSSEFFLTPAGCISYLCGQANKIRANKVKGE